MDVREEKSFIPIQWFSKIKISMCCDVCFSIILKINTFASFPKNTVKQEINNSAQLTSYTVLKNNQTCYSTDFENFKKQDTMQTIKKSYGWERFKSTPAIAAFSFHTTSSFARMKIIVSKRRDVGWSLGRLTGQSQMPSSSKITPSALLGWNSVRWRQPKPRSIASIKSKMHPILKIRVWASVSRETVSAGNRSTVYPR